MSDNDSSAADLGKSRMQLAWADTVRRTTGNDVLILAPFAVAEQTAEEGRAIGVDVNHARDGAEVRKGITITNYDRLHRFDVLRFGGIVLDESSNLMMVSGANAMNRSPSSHRKSRRF
jgi:hypothetical protein